MNRRLYLIGRPENHSSLIAVIVLLVMASALVTAGTSSVKDYQDLEDNPTAGRVYNDYRESSGLIRDTFRYTAPEEDQEIIPSSAVLTAENPDRYISYSQMSVYDPDTLQELNSVLKTDNCLFRITEDSVSKAADNALYVKLQDGQDPGNDRYCKVLYSDETRAVYMSDNYNSKKSSYKRMSYKASDRFMDIMSKLSENASPI